MRFPRLIVLVAAAAASCATSLRAADAAKTGTYTITFTEPGPQTSKVELAKRFAKGDVPAYDLAAEPFLIHVPEDYVPGTAYGVLVFLNYKDSTEPPTAIFPVLARHHLIYAMDTHALDHPEPAIAAIAADAVYNLSKTYTIEPRRVYVVGVRGGMTTALAFPDVFSAGMAWSHIAYYRPITDPKSRGVFPAQLPKIAPAVVGQAKSHPLIIATRPDADETTAAFHRLVFNALRADGFRAVKFATCTQEDFHYPNLTTPWLEDAITYFESAPAPATRPLVGSVRKAASRPTISEPQRLLTVAKFMIEHKSYPPARERLEELLHDYSDDPTATEAKALLDSISKTDPPKLEWKNETVKPRRQE